MILATEKQLSNILNISDRRVRELFKNSKLETGDYPLIKCVKDYINQTRSGDVNFVNLKTLAEILGVSDKTVKTLTNQGILIKNTDDKYDLKENLRNYLLSTDERNKKKAVEREYQEFRMNILKDKYHSDDDVRYILTDILIKFKSKIQGTAIKIDAEIDDVAKNERLNYLKNTLIECLEELSKYDPPSNRRKSKDV